MLFLRAFEPGGRLGKEITNQINVSPQIEDLNKLLAIYNKDLNSSGGIKLAGFEHELIRAESMHPPSIDHDAGT